jgi:hypothetical protein
MGFLIIRDALDQISFINLFATQFHRWTIFKKYILTNFSDKLFHIYHFRKYYFKLNWVVIKFVWSIG